MKEENNISIIFVGTLVPDEKEFHNPAFNRSGNLVQSGIVEGIVKQNIEIEVISSQPIPTYPKTVKLFLRKKTIFFKNITKLTIAPTFNLLIFREVFRGFFIFISVFKWFIKKRNKKRVIIVYNVYSPPIPFIYLIGKLTNSKSIAILYDLGKPPKSLSLNLIRRMIYKGVEFFAKFFIPKLDGRIVITREMANDYAPNKHFLLVDGGISSEVLSRLFPLKESENINETIFLSAGSLWEGNGTRMIIETLKKNQNPSIKLWFAGYGNDVDIIKKYSLIDKRVEYKGKLNLDELFEIYKSVDVLLNLRIIPKDEGKYLFPSKLLEFLAVGKIVISTDAVHIKEKYGHLCKVMNNANSDELSFIFDEYCRKSRKDIIIEGKKSREEIIMTHSWDNRSIEILDYIKKEVL